MTEKQSWIIEFTLGIPLAREDSKTVSLIRDRRKFCFIVLFAFDDALFFFTH